jgi:hypothetical protein
VDNLTLRRFLRARGHNVDKAAAMLLKFLRWRAEAAPGGTVPEEQVRGELEQDKVYMGGVDRTGRPIIVGLLAKHYSANRDMAEFKSTAPTTWPSFFINQNACVRTCGGFLSYFLAVVPSLVLLQVLWSTSSTRSVPGKRKLNAVAGRFIFFCAQQWRFTAVHQHVK